MTFLRRIGKDEAMTSMRGREMNKFRPYYKRIPVPENNHWHQML